MKFDIVFVAYNSEKWIEACFESISKSEYNLKDVSIIVVDNNSSDNTVKKLNAARKKYSSVFNDFKIIESSKNLGFGKGNNLGFREGSSEFVLFLNIDTELHCSALMELKKNIEDSCQRDAVWELRQFPYEHPKIYDPVTLNTSWCSGAAFVARREVFNKIGGFDEHIFMYAEDVDLSWRFRLNGYNLKYVPKAVVNHYCYKSANEVKPNQYYNSLINNLLLRYKFGNIYHILKGYIKFFTVVLRNQPFEDARKQLVIRFLKHYLHIGPFICWRIKNFKKAWSFKPHFYGWDYETIRAGAFYFNELPKKNPRVSIIVRTCGRPEVLRETLISLRNQTYKNFEVVIVEDGENISEDMIKTEFGDLDVIYKYSGEKVGRCAAGNLGLEAAKGKYINFLDDDDLFYSEHIEVLVKHFELNPEFRVAYSLAFETPIIVESRSPYKYKVKDYNLINEQGFNKVLLFHHNYIPIQCIMFEKEIFKEEGGIDEALDVLEDWDLWVRYACKNDFLYIPRVTSLYRVPHDRAQNADRQRSLDEALSILRTKHSSYNSNINVLDCANDVQDMYNSFVFVITKERAKLLHAKHPHITKLMFKSFGLMKRIIKRGRG